MTARRLLVVPLWLLGLFTFSGPVGMHIFVPALPAAARDLHAPAAELQLTVSLYILGLAFGQLVYGPLSDRFGRRPALLTGLAMFTAASVAGLFAPNAHALIAARFLQAFGGCSGLVLARAIIRDTSEGHDAAQRLALMNVIVTAGPAVAPILGGALTMVGAGGQFCWASPRSASRTWRSPGGCCRRRAPTPPMSARRRT